MTPEALEFKGNSRNTESSNDLSTKVRIKPTTYDGTSSWNDYDVQSEMLAEMTGWDEKTQAWYLAALNLRGSAQSILGEIETGDEITVR